MLPGYDTFIHIVGPMHGTYPYIANMYVRGGACVAQACLHAGFASPLLLPGGSPLVSLSLSLSLSLSISLAAHSAA